MPAVGLYYLFQKVLLVFRKRFMRVKLDFVLSAYSLQIYPHPILQILIINFIISMAWLCSDFFIHWKAVFQTSSTHFVQLPSKKQPHRIPLRLSTLSKTKLSKQVSSEQTVSNTNNKGKRKSRKYDICLNHIPGVNELDSESSSASIQSRRSGQTGTLGLVTHS